MYIAFRCYDYDNDQIVTGDEIRVILKNMPPHLHKSKRTLFSYNEIRVAPCNADEDYELHSMPTNEYMKLRQKDSE